MMVMMGDVLLILSLPSVNDASSATDCCMVRKRLLSMNMCGIKITTSLPYSLQSPKSSIQIKQQQHPAGS